MGIFLNRISKYVVERMWTIVGFTNIPVEFWKGPLGCCNLCCYPKCWHFIMEVSSGKCWIDTFLPSWVIAQSILCRLFPVFVNSTKSHFCRISSFSSHSLRLFHLLLLLSSFFLMVSSTMFVLFAKRVKCLRGELNQYLVLTVNSQNFTGDYPLDELCMIFFPTILLFPIYLDYNQIASFPHLNTFSEWKVLCRSSEICHLRNVFCLANSLKYVDSQLFKCFCEYAITL